MVFLVPIFNISSVNLKRTAVLTESTEMMYRTESHDHESIQMEASAALELSSGIFCMVAAVLFLFLTSDSTTLLASSPTEGDG